MVKSRAGHLVVLGAFVAALGVVFVLDALRWLLPMVTPDSAGIGAVAGGGMLTGLASALVLLLVGAGLLLFAALRGGRLK
ncbi:MAG: hypothetical protein DMF67_08870 [Acidobacteria bacterium]|nr:MAG: hypothetical protein DMF66_07555 [Acidobacteriota bacterium]PYS83456.1 MAG: hypothetical protein DMF67_08870 [Acidobacteriota bacterium]